MNKLRVGVLIGASAVACVDPELSSIGQERLHGMTNNGMTNNQLVANALTANSTANAALAGSTLSSASFAAAPLSQTLNDPYVVELMSYLVGCALDSSQSLTATVPATGKSYTFKGSLGLCPSWETSLPSPQCLERVSSCLLTRNNAFGYKVSLSIRGEDTADPAFLALASAVPGFETEIVKISSNPNRPIRSLKRCTSAKSGASRNCGWQAASVGECVPGMPVRVGAGSRPDKCSQPAIGSSTGDMMIRICEGNIACDPLSSRLLAQNEDSACGSAAPAVLFTCPSSGFYNVMVGPDVSTMAGTASPAADTGGYPASEDAVYSWREGAFYGNIFGAGALAPGVNVYIDKNGEVKRSSALDHDGAVYQNMWACYSSSWSTGDAYTKNRICANPGSSAGCAATSVGECETACADDDGNVVVGNLDYNDCIDDHGIVWPEPLTSFLYDECDLVNDAGLCALALEAK